MPTHAGYQQYKDEPRAQTAPSSGKLTPTTADIEGPFYKADSPHRSVLCDRPTLHLSGHVLDINGNAIRDILLDFWQANEAGEYDQNGFAFRGKQVADPHGHYRLATIRPGDYKIADDPPDFRCAHIHVKVTANGFKPLTTQLYFPDDDHNATDHWFDASRVIQFGGTRVPGEGRFDFVLEPIEGS